MSEDANNNGISFGSGEIEEENYNNEAAYECWISESVKDRRFEEDFVLGEQLSYLIGHFGKLFECKPKGTEVKMCLKMIPKNKERKVFIDDASHLLKLKHQNLVRLREIFEDRDNLYLVSDFHTGGEVLDRVCKKTTFSERDAAKILKQILEGLKYIHEEELVHGNLKPSNFIYENEEENSLVKITDIASYALLGREQLHHTVIESAEYCAPEVIKRESSNYPSDMWSFGAFAYTLLCGEKPFNSEDKEALYKSIFKGKYNKGSVNFDSLSINAKEFLERLLEVDCQKRPTAHESLRNAWLLGKATKYDNLEHCLGSMPNLDFILSKKKPNEEPLLFTNDDELINQE